MILPLFRRNPQTRTIASLYGAIVAQARSAAFYAGYGVPDTVPGRFELIVLHMVLLLDRLDRLQQAGRGVGQGVFDAFCNDLDDNLREMGIGDLAVPKKMRRFGEAFYGRQAAYRAALAGADARELEMALARNIFAVSHNDAAGSASGPVRLAHYTRAALRQLDAQEAATLLCGKVTFPDPEAVDHG